MGELGFIIIILMYECSDNGTYPDIPLWGNVPDPFETAALHTPGPLAISLIAMLGNESWFHRLQSQPELGDAATATEFLTDMCTGELPLVSFLSFNSNPITGGCSDIDASTRTPSTQVVLLAYEWFQSLSINELPIRLLTASIFFANEALLNAGQGEFLGSGRQISSSLGATVLKPSITPPAKFIISILLGIEIIALVGLAVFIYQRPTFSHRIDAVSAAVIGAQLSAGGVQMPELGRRLRKPLQVFEQRDGLIGIDKGHTTATDTNGGVPHERGKSGPATQQVSASSEDIELGDLENSADRPDAHFTAFSASSLVVGGAGII
jgi:hypothetical protein